MATRLSATREHGFVIPQTETPPADPTAIVGRRILAYIIDGVILIVLMVVLFATLASSEDVGSVFEAELTCELINNDSDADYLCLAADTTVILISDGDVRLLALIAGLYGFVTHLLLPALTGFSPGKAMVGLRIVNQESFEPAGFGANFLRWILWIVDSAPWCFPLVGLITGLSSNGHRRVGDMAAKTLVIDKKWVGHPLAVPGVNSVVALGAAPAAAPPFGAAPPPPPTGSTVDVAAPPPPPGQGFPTAPPVAPPPPVAAPAPPATAPAPPPPDPDPVMPPVPEFPEPEAQPPTPTPPAPPPPPAPPAPEPVPSRPGIDAPQWDAARDTYIQWDPELSEWMEWNEAAGAWIPISR
jgi:uncharacterized RDD family membrane protein YckC